MGPVTLAKGCTICRAGENRLKWMSTLYFFLSPFQFVAHGMFSKPTCGHAQGCSLRRIRSFASWRRLDMAVNR